jgi:hypothetical protein
MKMDSELDRTLNPLDHQSNAEFEAYLDETFPAAELGETTEPDEDDEEEEEEEDPPISQQEQDRRENPIQLGGF